MDEHSIPDLEDFAVYLRKHQLDEPCRIRFDVMRVREFLDFCAYRNLDSTWKQVPMFLDDLSRRGRVAEWQLEQARDAVSIYLQQYLPQLNKEQNSPAAQEKGLSQGKTKSRCGQSTAKPALACNGDRSSPPIGADVSGPLSPGWAAVLERVRSEVRFRRYSYSTEKAYVNWTSRFAAYAKVDPDSVDEVMARGFLTSLALSRNVAAATQNQAFNALLFTFRHVLEREMTEMSRTPRAKRGRKLPVVMTPEEVATVFSLMDGLPLLFCRLLYGSGLRRMEGIRLRVKDLDFEGLTVTVRSGKGDKDRATFLPRQLVPAFRAHLEDVKALHQKDLATGLGEVWLPYALARKYPTAAKAWGWQYVFPSQSISIDPRSGKARRHHSDESGLARQFKQAARRSGMDKPGSLHTLRHSFATELLRQGVNIRVVQDLLGHESVETTMIYTHVLRQSSLEVTSPLDTLPEVG